MAAGGAVEPRTTSVVASSSRGASTGGCAGGSSPRRRSIRSAAAPICAIGWWTVVSPIVAGISDFELTTEQYWVLTDEYNDVLATTTIAAPDYQPWHRPVTCPAVWTRQWGDGRVFVSTPGHSLDVVNDPNVRTIIERGILWASR